LVNNNHARPAPDLVAQRSNVSALFQFQSRRMESVWFNGLWQQRAGQEQNAAFNQGQSGLGL
jgi:hypothetical protein